MAKKKKKGPPPKVNRTPRKRVNVAQLFFMAFAILIILSMLITTVGPALF